MEEKEREEEWRSWVLKWEHAAHPQLLTRLAGRDGPISARSSGIGCAVRVWTRSPSCGRIGRVVADPELIFGLWTDEVLVGFQLCGRPQASLLYINPPCSAPESPVTLFPLQVSSPSCI